MKARYVKPLIMLRWRLRESKVPLTLLVKKKGVPDLTMIDLPGITRVPVRDQPENIYELQISGTWFISSYANTTRNLLILYIFCLYI